MVIRRRRSIVVEGVEAFETDYDVCSRMLAEVWLMWAFCEPSATHVAYAQDRVSGAVGIVNAMGFKVNFSV